MTVTIDVQQVCSGILPSTAQLQQWAELALANVDEDCELSIRLVDEVESADLNQTYRAKQGPTNILSFPFEAPIEMTPRLLGDLVICVPVVTSEARAQNKQLMDHWAHMIIHGCLHLLGYDHIEDEQAEEMEGIEKAILSSLEIDDPYREQGEENE